MQRSYDMKDPDAKTRFFQAVAAKIADFELEIERENYIEAVTGRFGVSFEGMRRMVMNVLMPVSYTHLDVYKRQVSGRGARGRAGAGDIHP